MLALNMPKSRNHEESRRNVCLLCMTKSKDMRLLNDTLRETVSQYCLTGYDLMNDERLPLGICANCRTILYNYRKGDFTRKIEMYDYSKIGQQPKMTRTQPECKCLVCEISHTTFGNLPGASNSQNISRNPVGRPTTRREPGGGKYHNVS